MSRPAALIIALLLVAGTVPAAAQTEEVDQLTLGDWHGGAQAWGTSVASGPTGSFRWTAAVDSTFRFTVTEEGVTGTFDLYNTSPMVMTVSAPTGEATATFAIDPGAQGEIEGGRSEFQFIIGGVTTSGSVVAGGQAFEVDGSPSGITITNTIEYLACDHAIGNWDVSITQEIAEAGWTPAWNGYWAASPYADDDRETAAEEFIEGLSELFADYQAFEASLGTSLGPDADYDPRVLDPETLFGLVERSTELMNRLHNLSACDAEAIGAETLQEWRTALAGVMSSMILTAADRLALTPNLFVGLSGLYALVGAADATNAYRGAAEAWQVEDALMEMTSKAVEGHLRLSRGEGDAPCDAGCRQDEYHWAAGAIALAATHGWSVTVEGTTYSPAEAPSLVAEPPGGDE